MYQIIIQYLNCIRRGLVLIFHATKDLGNRRRAFLI